MVLAFVLLAMLVAALNYNNSLAFIFTFLITGITLNAMWFTYRQLAGLRLSVQPQSPVFAGERGELKFLIENPSDYDRYSLLVSAETAEKPRVFDCDAAGSIIAALTIRAELRGLYRCHRFRIATMAPLGIFYAWSWQTLDLKTWVYPSPHKVSPLPLEGEGSQKPGSQQLDLNGDDFDSLREHRNGDSPQQIPGSITPARIPCSSNNFPIRYRRVSFSPGTSCLQPVSKKSFHNSVNALLMQNIKINAMP